MIGGLYQFPVVAEVYVFLHHVQTDSSAGPSSYPTGGNRTTLPRLKLFLIKLHIGEFHFSLFHRAFYITNVSFTPTHALVLSYNKIT